SAVYFCVLEALQNVAKYADASRATVRLWATAGELGFEVSDDGVGFDPGSSARGSGFQGMIDRVDAVGGAVEIVSAPGEGTAVRGRIPIGTRGPAS
ncbi:MAG TPA: ATP-binding protein, partial [Actinomycetota bacterium]|nr:ATP-binding protein [Actinomycetota bacterium]